VMTDLRSWLKYHSGYDNWIGGLAAEILEEGWLGYNPDSLKKWVTTRNTDVSFEAVDSLIRFFQMDMVRQKRTHGR